MHLAVLGIAALYVGSTVLTPLYPIYERTFRISEVRSARSMRRTSSATWPCCFCSAVSPIGLVAAAAGPGWLFTGRVMSGFAAGLGAATLTAWIAELEPTGDHTRVAAVTSSGNLAGLAFGALAAGLLASTGRWPSWEGSSVSTSVRPR